MRRHRENFAAYWRANKQRYLAHVRNRRARIRNAEGQHTAEDVAAQIVLQRGRCFWCDADVADGSHTVDHYVPLARGGSNGAENIVIACGKCNSMKGAKLPEEFVYYLARKSALKGEVNG